MNRMNPSRRVNNIIVRRKPETYCAGYDIYNGFHYSITDSTAAHLKKDIGMIRKDKILKPQYQACLTLHHRAYIITFNFTRERHRNAFPVCAKNYWAHWPFGPVAITDLLARNNTMSTKFPHASWASGLFTGPIGNWLAHACGKQSAKLALTRRRIPLARRP